MSPPSEDCSPPRKKARENSSTAPDEATNLTSSAPPFALPNAVVLYQNFLTANGLTDSRASAALYQVHEDLRLARGWTDLRVVREGVVWLLGVAAPEFDSVFPSPVEPGTDRTQAVVPMTTEMRLTPRVMSNMCSAIVHPDTKRAFRCFTAAIVDWDSTTAYYRIFGKFDEIVDSHWKQTKDETDGAGAGDDSDSDGNAVKSDDIGSGSDSSGSVEPPVPGRADGDED